MASILGVETLQHTNGTDALTIDSTGRVLMPVVPAWRTGKIASQAVTADTSEIAVPFDKGSGASSNCFLNGGVTISSGKIVVPIAGIYQVNLNMRIDNITSGYIVSRILKNLEQSNQEESYHIVSVGGGAYNTVTITDVYEAEAGDEFSVSNLSSADGTYTISSTSTFSGHLVG